MLARDELVRLLAAVVKLYAESTGNLPNDDRAGELCDAVHADVRQTLEEEGEELVTAVMTALAQIVGVVAEPDGGGPAMAPPVSVLGALGGAEMVIRGEIAAGHADRIPRLLPTFAYLATVPLIGGEEAGRLARAAAKLVGGSNEDAG
jgi:hypothetical protein